MEVTLGGLLALTFTYALVMAGGFALIGFFVWRFWDMGRSWVVLTDGDAGANVLKVRIGANNTFRRGKKRYILQGGARMPAGRRGLWLVHPRAGWNFVPGRETPPTKAAVTEAREIVDVEATVKDEDPNTVHLEKVHVPSELEVIGEGVRNWVLRCFDPAVYFHATEQNEVQDALMANQKGDDWRKSAVPWIFAALVVAMAGIGYVATLYMKSQGQG